jgi:hypothetical protein
MPPRTDEPLDAAALERYVEEAARTLGLPIEPEWRRAIAEHYRRLLDASAAIEAAGLCDGDPAGRFEP